MPTPTPYTRFSHVGRVKRVERRLDQTQKIYEEVINVAGPELKINEGGSEILERSRDQMRNMWRLVWF